LDGDALRRWFALHELSRTLITTRSREYGSLAKGIDLSVLTPDEAYQLLTSRRKPAGTDEEQAGELAKDLGYHALALDVTASALLCYGGAEPYRQFREELANPGDDALELSTDLADALPNGHEKSIAQTMLRSIRGLEAEGQDFLRLASLLAVAPIPASLVTAVFEKADGLERAKAEQCQRKAFSDVTKASLAEIAGENQEARSVHTLVSRAVRFHEKSAPERTQALRAAAVEALLAEIAKAAEDPRVHKRIEFHVAHARQIVTTLESIREANLVDLVARYDFERGAYASARTLYERELEFNRRVRGPEHTDTLTSTNDLALSLIAQGDAAEARKLQEETLAVRRRVLGPEHLHTATSMGNLATTLRAQGDLVRARKLHEEALAIERGVLGPEHPHTLGSMANLASTLREQGDLAGSRKLEEETLDIFRRVLGSEHPRTLTMMINLAITLNAQGDLVGARRLQEEALAVQRRVLGPEHPYTLTSMSNLGCTLWSQGDLVGARKLQEETLIIQRRVLGPEHPSTLASMNNLANTLQAQGDLSEARKLQEETLPIKSRVLGPQHPDTSITAWGLLRTLYALGEREAARAVLERDLRWLLDRDPATFGADQRKIRELVAHAVKELDGG
jgi:hypothetical protein